MASIAIVGDNGTGKSTSYGNIPEIGIKGLDPKETVVINVAGKDLPFRGWNKLYKGDIREGGNYLESSNSPMIDKAINYISKERPDIKNIVIDDGQFLLSFEYMSRAKENGYNKFLDIGVNISNIIKSAKDSRKDLKVYFLWHPEDSKEYGMKMKTIGAMLDNYLTLEGLFTVVLYTKVSKTGENKMSYNFVTNNDGKYPSKSPVGMFKELYVPNDLGFVSESIDKYNSGE